MYVTSIPPVVHVQGKNVLFVASFHDAAADIGRHVRGLMFVQADPTTREVVSTQRIALCADTDAVDHDTLWPWASDLVRGIVPGDVPTIVS